MKKSAAHDVVKITGVIGSLVLSASVYANSPERTYIVPSVGYHTFDNELSLDDEVSYGFALGRELTDNWAIELAYNTANTQLADTEIDVDADYVHLDALYHFHDADSDSKWTPYAVFGVGEMSYEDKASDSDSTQWNAGVGIQYAMNSHFSLRSDVRGLLVADEVEEGVLFNLGFVYAFGEAKAKSKPVAAPAPEPVAVVPAPAPEPVVAPEPETSKEVCEMFEGSLEGVVFKVNSADLTDNAKQVLLKTADLLKSNENLDIEIQAYTDSDGSSEFNRNLSLKRAESVKSFLVSQGAHEHNMTAKGFGEDSPVASNATAEGKAQNRRVEIKPHSHVTCEK